ncbi:MAG: hypothetical protein JWN95_1691 [Frankiales bacterium]|nr:hypothetical protein [Frankiales bacterium]
MPRRFTARPAVTSLAIAGSLVGLLTVGTTSAFAGPAQPAGKVAAQAITPVHSPRGHLDTARLTNGVVTYTGWAVDPDLAGTVRVVTSVDGRAVTSVLATGTRNDVGRIYPQFGTHRGFSGRIALPTGSHSLCWAIGNLGPGATTSLGCRSFKVVGETTSAAIPKATRAPIGRLDKVSYKSGRLTVAGWTIDPDTPTSTFIDVQVNGMRVGSAQATIARADVAKVYPSHGLNHGYNAAVPYSMASGNYLICVLALNTSTGTNTTLVCRMLTVLPNGVPAELGADTAVVAAAAIQAQAVRSGAAKAAAFATAKTPAAKIAIATRALLHQATGRSAKPPVVKGLPAFAKATPTKVVDEQAVMGKTADLGSYPAVKTGGRAGAAHSLELYTASSSLVPPGGAGDGLIGAAAVLPANGVTVHPAVPAYPAKYAKLRAEVAIDNALVHLGDPYVWAAGGPTTFDCSGLTQWAYAKAGIRLDHYTGTQAKQGVRVKTSQLLPGDLVLFGSSLHHVGMYLGAGYMLDAPDTGAYVRLDKISWFGDFSLAVRP